MIAAIPVDNATFLAVANLKAKDFADSALFTQFEPLIMAELARQTTEAAFAEAAGDNPGPAVQTAFKFGYCYLMQCRTIRQLSIKTVGGGVIRSTGTENNARELLTQTEIDQLETAFELKALSVLQLYLSESGQIRLNELRGDKAGTGSRGCLLIP